MDPAILELCAEGAPDDEVAVIVRLADPVSLPVGVRVIAQLGPIITVRMPRSELKRVHDDRAVRSMKRARRYAPAPAEAIDVESDRDATEAGLDPRPGDRRRPDGDWPTGRGVVVAHIDWGVDFAHSDFRDADGRTRLLGLWDQGATYDPAHPNLYGYGRIHDGADIDRALAADDPYGALGYYPFVSDSGRGTHGTHTLGISAGNGRAGGPVGLAPEAKLAFVHLSTSTADTPTLLGDSVSLLEAYDYIGRIAGPNAVVVNASLGRQAGDHTGQSLTEQGMDAFLLAAPGRAICQSTGNYFDRDIHARGELRPGETRTLRIRTEAADKTPNEIDLWYPGVDRLRITLRAPASESEFHVAPGESQSVVLDGQTVGTIYHRLCDPNNGDNEVTLFLYRAAPPGQWELILFGEDIADGRYHAWVERDAGCPHCQARFAPEDSDPTTTTGTICNGLRTIAIGAYNAHRDERPLAPFSSSGPTRDGRQKPDCVAPGVQVLAARSRPMNDVAGFPLLTRMSGTSMACPHVTGTIALMFESAGRPLFIEETRRLLLAHTDPPAADADLADRLRLGSGYLNTEAAVAAARPAGRHLAASVRRSQPVATVGEDRPEDAEATRDELRRAASSLPFQIQVPLGGGAPAIALPLGGPGSPFAFTTPLGSAPAAVVPSMPSTSDEPLVALAAEARPCHCIRCDHECEQDAVVEEAALAFDELQIPIGGGAPASDDLTRGFDAMNTRENDMRVQEPERDDAEAQREPWRRGSGSALPFQFQIPIGGGSPALALPIGGSGSPLAFSVPLGGTPVPIPPTAIAQPTPPAVATPALPIAWTPAEPAVVAGGVDAPVLIPSFDAPLYQPPEASDAGELDEVEAYGEQVLEAAEACASNGGLGRSASMLSSLFGHVDDRSSRVLGFDGHRASATALFNALVFPDYPSRPRVALHRHYAQRFELLARPGTMMLDLVPKRGDLLVRVARGEGWGHVAVVASPGLYIHHQLAERGLRGEGYPLPLPGWHVHVVEAGPRPRRSDDRFARRLGDASGVVLGDTLLLRPRAEAALEAEGASEDDGNQSAAQRPAMLRKGASEAAVREAQQKLNRVHADSVALGLLGLTGAPLNEDGRFDQRTEQAVADFQQQVFGDPSRWNGVLDAATWAQLDLVTGTVASTTEAPPPRSTSSGRPMQRPAREDAAPLEDLFESAGRPTIGRGSQGASVREAQSKLNSAHARQLAAGATGLPACPLVEDGLFGDNTFKATRGLQQVAFPTAPQEWDGVIGQKTWSALDRFSEGPLPVPPPSPDGRAFPPDAVIDERIDVDAQFSLQRLSRGTPEERADAVGMLGAIKGSQLAGIFGDNLKKSAELAARIGTQRTLLVPKGEDAALVLEPGDTPVVLAPTIVFRGGDPPKQFGIRKEPQRLDAALRKAWATFVLLRAGKLGRCDVAPDDGPAVAFTDAEGAPLRVLGNAMPPLCELPDPPIKPIPPKPPKPPVKLPPCAIPPTAKSDPSALVLSKVGTIDYSPGTMTTSSGRTLHVDGTVFYPATADGSGQPFNEGVAKSAPIVFMAHGNHETFHDPADRKKEFCPGVPGTVKTPNHQGYVYFQEQLARMGIIAVSVDCNETNCDSLSPNNITHRAELIAASIKHFQLLATGGDPVFGNHIDFTKVGLMGHSRGGEAVVLVPELTGPRAASGATIKAVLALAPTDSRASSGRPRNFAFMTILPAGDGDVVTNDGAKFYDAAVPSPFKSQLYVHEANHNFFNREWVHNPDHRTGAGPMPPADHEHILSVYGCALFRTTLLGHGLESLVVGRETPPGARTANIHLSAEVAGAMTVEDHDDGNPLKNSLGQTIVKFGYATAAEKPFSQGAAAAFNTSFFGKTTGLILQRSAAGNQFTSPLAKATDLSGKEVWIRCAEVYTGSVPAGATGFKIGLTDTSGVTVFVDSDDAGGLPRPFDRKADDATNPLFAGFVGIDLTKSMLKTLRFPATCFTRGSKLDIKKTKAVLLHLDRADKRSIAFDQLQIV